MINRLREIIHKIIKDKQLAFLYLFVLLLLSYGLVKTSGLTYFPLILLYAAAFIIFFFSYYFLFRNKNFNLFEKIKLSNDKLHLFSLIALAGIILIIIIHLVILKSLPLFDAWFKTNILETARVRQDVSTHTPAFIGYASSFAVKAIIPFFILYFYATGQRKLLVILILVSVFYILNLLQKNYFVTLFVPVILYALLHKRFLSFGIFCILVFVGVYGLIFVANPELRGYGDGKEINLSDSMNAATSGFLDRIFVTPGKVVSLWFSSVPDKYPFLNGCGYGFLAPVLGCDHVDYSHVLYAEHYPQYIKVGLHGSVNTANFMYDYANFGKLGLLLSGFILATWMYFIQRTFSNQGKMLLILNFYFIMMLSSSALTTMLFSGGWILTVILYAMFEKGLNK